MPALVGLCGCEICRRLTETRSAQEGMPTSWHQKEENCLLWPYHQAQHTPTCIIRREHRRQARQRQTNNIYYMWMGTHARTHARARTLTHTHMHTHTHTRTHWSGFGYVNATRKAQDRSYWRQLIASDLVYLNLTVERDSNPTQQWMEPGDDNQNHTR